MKNSPFRGAREMALYLLPYQIYIGFKKGSFIAIIASVKFNE
jgi:hypothetical protein